MNEITKLGPGSIIKFHKSCDELVELIAGNCSIADGEVVKVGDKIWTANPSDVDAQRTFLSGGKSKHRVISLPR